MNLYKEIGYGNLPGYVPQKFTNVNSLVDLELLLSDGKVIECLTSIAGEVIRFPYEIETDNTQLRDICEEFLYNKGLLVYTLEIARALIIGMTTHEVVWERQPDGITFPKDIILREAGIIRYVYNNGMVPYLDLPGKKLQPLGNRKWILSKFWSIPNTDPYGNGLGEALAPFIDVRNQSLLDLSKASSDASEPVRIGRYPENSSDEEITEFGKLVRAIGQAKSIILPEGFIIDFLMKSSDTGYRVSIDLFERANSEISMIILGEDTAGKSTANGSYSKDAISLSLRLTRSIMLAKLVEFSLNSTLFKWIQELNFPGAEPPRLKFKYPTLEIVEVNDQDSTGL